MKAPRVHGKTQSVGNAEKNTTEDRIGQPKQSTSNTGEGSAGNHGRIDDEREAEWLNEEDAQFLLSTILSGKICRPTPFAEIARDCPAVWRCALQVFAGNKSAARAWLETRSPIFAGRRPIAIALQMGGRRKVLQELKRLSGSKR